ncbi:hypothetical protein GCM10022215_37150 [Nocardioides fonticola]|uniref:SdpI family protein n=1 Tax=Nocardioides fonticola TaxID=450363 RepID=A0ABP7XX43_9ACTN
MDAALPGLLSVALVLGTVSVLLARAIEADRLPRNRLVGIRTRDTLRSDAAWLAGHRAAAATLRQSGAAALVLTALGIVVRVAGPVGPGVALVGAAALVGLCGLLVATLKAVGAARRVP